MTRKTAAIKDVSYATKKPSKRAVARQKLSIERRANPITLFEHYFHIGNSGVTFRLVDNGYGPKLQIESGAFGNIHVKQDILLAKDALHALADSMSDAVHFKFTEDYCHAAEPEGEMASESGGEVESTEETLVISPAIAEAYASTIQNMFVADFTEVVEDLERMRKNALFKLTGNARLVQGAFELIKNLKAVMKQDFIDISEGRDLLDAARQVRAAVRRLLDQKLADIAPAEDMKKALTKSVRAGRAILR